MSISTKSIIKTGLLTMLLVLSNVKIVFGQAAVSTNPPPTQAQLNYRPGEVLVKFKADVTDDQIGEAFRGAGLQMIKQIKTSVMRQRGDIGITRALTAMPVEQAAALLKRLPGIEYAEPNWVYTHQVTSEDPLFLNGSLWGMYGNLSSPANQYGSQAAEAWAAGYIGSQSVVVGVIDEGVQITHPDLRNNIWVNTRETAGDAIDNDGNGYVDDINGWDFFENNSSVYDGPGDDHGTHVTGTIGAQGNMIGVVGVNWTVSIIPGKFLGPNGGDTADAIEAVDYFTALKYRGVNIVALNNSWGGAGYSQGLHDAIIRAAKAGILFVAAAGNGNPVTGRAINTDSSPYYPACYDTRVGTSTEGAASYDAVISVTAIDSSGKKGSFANYGATTVDLGAPGVNVSSTLPPDGYGSGTGTSMATPHVTGAIALYASQHPDAQAPEMRSAILGSTALISSLSGKTVTGGRLDLSTVITPPTPPSGPPAAPSALHGVALSHSEVALTWADNSDNESRFVISRNGLEVITVGANTTSFIDSGLTQETTYIYSIKACNSSSQGCSAAVESAPVTTLSGPAPTTASFVGIDTATQGNWVGKYGSEGFETLFYTAQPAYGTVFPAGYTYHTWANPSSDPRALQTPDGTSRFAACYYSFDTQGAFNFDVNITDGNTHRISLYCVDFDIQQRQQTIEIVDRNFGNLLNSQYLDAFSGGKYLTWDISGPVIIRVKWVDNPASGGDNAVVSGVFFDPPSDTPSISSPAAGATVSGIVTVSASASDDEGVTQVAFYANGTLIGTDTIGTDGWSISWDTTVVADGNYALTAVAQDTVGQTATSPGVNVIVDNIDDLPTVAIISPANGAHISGTVTISAAATDDRGVSQVEFFAGATSIGLGTETVSGVWSIDWTPGLDGNYALTASARDSSGQITPSARVNVTVDNSAPTTMHCGDLHAIRVSVANSWVAQVTVTIHDEDHALVPGVTVTGSWSGGYSGGTSGSTDSSGKVALVTGNIPKNKSSVTFTLNNLTDANLTYKPADNHDPDGDSNGTSITVYKP